MDELQNTLANAELEQKLALFPQLLQQGERGLNYLIDCLSDRELVIRAKAYELLANINISSQQVQQAIAPGILFNPGDRTYKIIQYAIYFNDSFYSLYQPKKKDRPEHLSTYQDYQEQGYQIISFDEFSYIVSTKFHYINYHQADLAAKQLNEQIISQFSITEFEINDDLTLIENWCDRHQIIQEVQALQRERNKQLGLDKWHQKVGMSYDYDQLDIYWATVEQYLKSISNFELLDRLWKELVGNLTIIQEITFDKPTYLKIDPYYSQILIHNIRQLGEEEPPTPEEAETNFLLKALNNSKLEIRVLAYKLLRGVDRKKAERAVRSGVRLNPGDKVYSVYRSGICYTDQDYFLNDFVEDLNYEDLNDIRKVICERDYYEHEDPRRKCQRIYCFLEKEQAKKKAEDIHREMIQNNGIGISPLGFEWRKENPDFDAKQWCGKHNIPYPNVEHIGEYADDYGIILKIKDFIWSDEDKSLEDNLRRSRYIYHPEHIDTWCNDNQIDYDPNLDNWDNYRKVMDYLYLPKNIDLLSKFWKDGVGHFAFVREEIVQKQIYIKIEDNLIDLSDEEKCKINPALKSENYPELASEYLIDIIEVDRSSLEQKSKARKLLQDIAWEDIPF